MVSLVWFAFYHRTAFRGGFESAPALALLGAPLTTTHRVISYAYPSTLLRTGDSLYRLIAATYSNGEFYHYTYPSTSLRTGDAVGSRLTLVTSNGSTSYEYDAANRLVLSSYCAESKGEIEVLIIENS